MADGVVKASGWKGVEGDTVGHERGNRAGND